MPLWASRLYNQYSSMYNINNKNIKNVRLQVNVPKLVNVYSSIPGIK